MLKLAEKGVGVQLQEVKEKDVGNDGQLVEEEPTATEGLPDQAEHVEVEDININAEPSQPGSHVAADVEPIEPLHASLGHPSVEDAAGDNLQARNSVAGKDAAAAVSMTDVQSQTEQSDAAGNQASKPLKSGAGAANLDAKDSAEELTKTAELQGAAK